MEPERLLRAMFEAAVAAVQASDRLVAALPPPPRGRTVVVGAGKAAAAMARAVEDHWAGPSKSSKVWSSPATAMARRPGASRWSRRRIPTRTRRGSAAARRILDLAQGLGPDDLLLCLISGGGSALLAAPAEGLALADKQAVTRALLRSGATISEINCVRKHLSAIKGGRLAAAAAPAPVVALLISDVPGDDPSVIASGPTVARSQYLRPGPRRARQVPDRAAAGGRRPSDGSRRRDAEAG